MIGYLRGVLLEKTPESVIIDVGGVGYEVAVPASSFCALPPEGETACLYIHTHVREDAIKLFGFATLFDRKVFELLLGVSSVGPKVALALLGLLNGHELCEAVQRNRVAALVAIPGVGAKTAERLILELRGKAEKIMALYQDSVLPTVRAGALPPQTIGIFGEPVVPPGSDKKSQASKDSERRLYRKRVFEDVHSALVNMGYKEKMVDEALKDYESECNPMEPLVLEDVLRGILRKMSQRLLNL